MGLRFGLARAAGAVSTWALVNVFRRPAANFPGKLGIYLDPRLIAHLRSRIGEGTIVVVGTNGKTTVTNLIADALEESGKTVACNRTGANLDSGVATALLHTKRADWGVLESDELWLPKVVEQLQPDYIVLLNLFRDQLDRAGEIDHVQQSIMHALASSPKTTLVYNADDPLCQFIADAAENPHVSFGIGENLALPQDTVIGGGVCQRCESTLAYEWHQYGQLGKYQCPTCSFAREDPKYRAHDVRIDGHGTSFTLADGVKEVHPSTGLPGAYMAYNLLAVCAATACCDVAFEHVNKAVQRFAPSNGRLQSYEFGDCHVLLNLAKNPTGMNQNIRIVLQEPGPKAVAFYINDKEADGHDVSWLWDVDFQELADVDDLVAYAGGLRGNDMQVRLKYAVVDALLVEGARDFLEQAWAAQPHAKCFLIANYTALPKVKAELDHMQQLCEKGQLDWPPKEAAADQAKVEEQGDNPATQAEVKAGELTTKTAEKHEAGTRKLVIAHLYPELLNLYGDGGNVAILAQRARQRGLDVQVVRVEHGQLADLSQADIVFLGGGPDREQHLASISLLDQADALRAYVEDDGVLLAICGGFQILGREWLLGDEAVPGLGLVDITTKRAPGGSHNRLVGNIMLRSPLADLPVIGYENHAGRTYLGDGCKPFGSVINKRGKGNNDEDGADGVLYKNVLGTYLHGPLLAKNPEVADWLIHQAIERRDVKDGCEAQAFPPIDDSVERAANKAMQSRLQ